MAMILCPWCKKQSSDPEFCDHCNREIAAAARKPEAAPPVAKLRSGVALDCSGWGRGWQEDPETPLTVSLDAATYRLYGIRRTLWAEFRPRLETRAAVRIPELPPIETVPTQGGMIIAVEAWPDRPNRLLTPARGAFRDGVLTGLDECLAACRTLGKVFAALHQAGLVWLTFDPARLEVRGEQLRVTNLDLGVFLAGTAPEQLRLSRRYSPPEVCRFVDVKIGPATDVFHLGAYAYYHLTDLLPEGFAGRGLEAFEFRIPSMRIFQPHLPLGIGTVIERALAKDPARRFPTINEFLDELAFAVEAARARQAGVGPLRCDAGGCSRTGRAKTALGTVNQDRVFIQPLPAAPKSPDRTLAREGCLLMVADGITNSRVGSGDLASEMGCQFVAEELQRRWPELKGPQEVESALIQSCQGATEKIVEKALTLIQKGQQVRECDMMSTTAVIGLLEGGRLHLANVGDSRAYLIRGATFEQLTVDGDVASVAIAEGMPPELVQNMGLSARAIARCLGACCEDDQGRLLADMERATPAITRWPLAPGDVLLFCTDGLIEEGAFLEPQEAAEIIMVCGGQPIQTVADRLVMAADSRQREPTPEEPRGFGDNVSCVVVRLAAAD
jgi:serine/threonine protein phosphatase PrpC